MTELLSIRSWSFWGWGAAVLMAVALGSTYHQLADVRAELRDAHEGYAELALAPGCPECPAPEVTCEPWRCPTCTPVMCEAPPTCSAPRVGETLMFEEIQAHRREIVKWDVYNQGAYDILEYVEAFQRVDQWPDGPWAWDPDMELMGVDTSLAGWDGASSNWFACCEQLLEVWPGADPLAWDFPEGFPAYCK